MTDRGSDGRFAEVDPFGLPEWLGVEEVTWVPSGGIHAGHVRGRLTSGQHDDLPCDLLAVDQAFPHTVADESTRHEVHQAWHYRQVHVVEYDGHLTLAVPGTRFSADLVLDALERFARAVGAHPEQYSVWLRLGSRAAPA